MSVRFAVSVAATWLVLVCAAEARHAIRQQHYQEEDYSPLSVVGRRPHPGVHSHQQGRVFPGALAIKKLVLLKFKKIIPISLIVLKSDKENEAEVVPVYPTSEIPSNVQFIATPNGISGHKDVQAIAIPTELHHQLELNGMANLAGIEALLNEAQEEAPGESEQIALVHQSANHDNVPLNVKDDDEDQPLQVLTQPDALKIALGGSDLRRVTNENAVRQSFKPGHQTAIEEIPLYLYSAEDTPIHNIVQNTRKTGHRQVVGRRHHA